MRNEIVDVQNESTDLSHEKRMLTSAVLAGDLNGRPDSTSNLSDQTEIAVTQLVPWLKTIGLHDVAEGLLGDDPIQGKSTGQIWTSEYTEKVRKYRELHGTKATAEHFNISGARIRQKLPNPSAGIKSFSIFKQGSS